MARTQEILTNTKTLGQGVDTSSRSLEPELLTVEELARWLKLSVKGVYNLVESRRIPHLKVGSSRLRFLPSEIRSWLEESRVPLRRKS